MPVLSAGILLWRRRDDGVQVLIAHMGGPLWSRKDEAAWSVPKGEIAYLLDREAEGRGYMTETFEAILRVAFGELGLGKLFLRAIVGNERSARLARKFGFTREGVLREEFATLDGRRVDLEYYGLLAREFKGPA